MVLTREVIGVVDLPLTLHDPAPEPGGSGLEAAVEGLDRRMIREALARSGDVQTRAAELLGYQRTRAALQTEEIPACRQRVKLPSIKGGRDSPVRGMSATIVCRPTGGST